LFRDAAAGNINDLGANHAVLVAPRRFRDSLHQFSSIKTDQNMFSVQKMNGHVSPQSEALKRR
jgi:hypothetical protein